MNSRPATPPPPLLVLRDGEAFRDWIRSGRADARGIASLAAFVAGSTAVYGVALGAWRSPWMALFVAVKLPAVFLGTTAFVALFAWLTALAAGTGLRLRDAVATLLGAMAVAGWTLLALAPVAWFLVWSAAPAWDPGLARSTALRGAHNTILLVHVAVISAAGLLGNAAVYSALRGLVPAGRRLLPLFLAWLAAYGAVGAQLAWILRPLLGSPNMEVAFLREDALAGNFFETVFGRMIPFLLGFRP